MPDINEAIVITAESLGGITNWPVRVDVEYEEDGPALLCDSWVAGRRGHIVQCRTSFHGETIGELLARLTEHVAAVEHYEHPLASVYNYLHAGKSGGKW